MYLKRAISVAAELNKKSILLLGPRRTGKSSYIHNELRPDAVYNLLFADTFQKLSARPSFIRESLKPNDQLVVIDEIQKLPLLLDEVHAMIEEHGIRFLLTGSSARKLRRSSRSGLAGRAHAKTLHPLCVPEIPDFDLTRALLYGTMPPIYLSDDPEEELKSYTGEYLQEEIRAEALARKIESFSRFLHQAALGNTELLNYESLGSDAQVPPRTVREYYAVLQDTLLGSIVEPFSISKKRKSAAHAKFYFFDIGVVHALSGVKHLSESSHDFGKAFEHFIFREIRTYLDYKMNDTPLHFWRSTEKLEVDFIIGDAVAIEAKATTFAQEKHLRGLNALIKEGRFKKCIVVSRDPKPRTIGQIVVLPWRKFIDELWAGKIV